MPNEIANNKLKRLLERSEDHTLDYKSADLLQTPNDKNRYKIAKQLVAFSNRDGGELVFGIEDTSREPEAKCIIEEEAINTLSQVSRMQCSPPVQFDHEYYTSDNGDLEAGDVLVVNIHEARDIPHAITDKTNGEIQKREYRLRGGDESRLVTDEELEWLFTQDIDSTLEYDFRIWYTYGREQFHGSAVGLPLPAGTRSFGLLFTELSDDDRKILSESDSRSEFFVEIAPFAILDTFIWTFSNSWLVEIQSRKGISRATPQTDIAKDEITITDVDIVGDPTQLKDISFDPIETFQKHKDDFCVPPNTQVTIEYPSQHGKRNTTLRLSKSDAFTITIKFFPSQWTRGFPLGHPVRSAYSGLDSPPDRGGEFTDKFASIEIDSKFNAEFNFPDIAKDEFDTYHSYAETIIELLENRYDVDAYLDGLPDASIFKIEDKLDRILEQIE